MAELRDVMVYICQHYPYPRHLSNGRLTKLVYLADWRSSLVRGRQMTDLEWKFYHYGPYVEDIIETANEDPGFNVAMGSTMYDEPKVLIQYAGDAETPSLSADDREILDFVIEGTSDKNWSQFIQLVYSTYPIVTQQRYATLDLPMLAQKYKEAQPLLQQ